MPTSALLPMGGAVSGVAGANWALIGDAAACVNPLNGEGIDYGLESGRLVVETMAEHDDLSQVWPALLRDHYGEAFSIARRLAGLVTIPRLLPGPRPGRHALRLADDPGPALDGQPGHRRRPRSGRARVALGRPPVDRARPPAAVRLRTPGDGAVVPRDRRGHAHDRARPRRPPPLRRSRAPAPHGSRRPGEHPRLLPRLPLDRAGRPRARPMGAVLDPARRLATRASRAPWRACATCRSTARPPLRRT